MAEIQDKCSECLNSFDARGRWYPRCSVFKSIDYSTGDESPRFCSEVRRGPTCLQFKKECSCCCGTGKVGWFRRRPCQSCGGKGWLAPPFQRQVREDARD